MIWIHIPSTDSYIAHDAGTTYRAVKFDERRAAWRVYQIGDGPDQLLYSGTFHACQIAARNHANAGRIARQRIAEIIRRAHASIHKYDHLQGKK